MKTLFRLALALSTCSNLPAQDSTGNRSIVPIRVQKKLALVIGNQQYPKSPLKNPINDATAIAQARGGSWDADPSFVRASFRGSHGPWSRDDYVGFRCAGDLP